MRDSRKSVHRMGLAAPSLPSDRYDQPSAIGCPVPSPPFIATQLRHRRRHSSLEWAVRWRRAIPPNTTAPPIGSPYTYPFEHIRCGQTYSGSDNGMMDLFPDGSQHRPQQPVLPPPLVRSGHRLCRRERSQDLRRRGKIRPLMRVDSTQPRDHQHATSSPRGFCG
ncbi:hypothetical protein BJV77DRAFT_712152 [Russula vinacea]|nr:hypothetical protein BJV77DRAFT_712152 [Russula vinacea]